MRAIRRQVPILPVSWAHIAISLLVCPRATCAGPLLPAGERLDGLRWRRAELGVSEDREKAHGDVRRDESVTVSCGADRLRQEHRARILEQEPASTRLQRPVDLLIEDEGGDDDDGERIVDVWSGELPGGLDPVEVRHADVEQTHVGP
jgi:hypothetical protein